MQSELSIDQIDRDGAVRETAHEAVSILEETGDTRLDFFKKAGIAGGALMGGGALLGALVPEAAMAGGRPPKSFGRGDIGILNFALTLEYLESAFYNRATRSNDESLIPFITGDAEVFLRTVTRDERAHVKALKSVLKGKAAKKPEFDFGETTENYDDFVDTAFALENTGVGAYAGQAFNIKSPDVLAAALSIITIEARHASVIGLIRDGTPKGIAPNGPFDKPKSAKAVLRKVGATGFIQG